MREEIASLINKPPRHERIDTIQKARAYKKFVEETKKQLAKRLSETQLLSIYSKLQEYHR